MYKNQQKDKIISAVSKLIPGMLTNKQKPQQHNDIFHTSVSVFDNSLRSRKSTSDRWWEGGHLNSGKRNQNREQLAKEPDICEQLNCANIGTDYTERTTLHGLRYVGDSELHIFERLFWSVAFIMGILGAGYYISALYAKWRETPMIVSLTPMPVPLESIPFPAVTICNMNGARKTVAEPIMKSNKTDELTLLSRKIINELCGNYDDTRIRANWTIEQKILIKVSQSCQEMLVSCVWRGSIYNCNDIFNPELTDEGMCCSFNKVRRDFIYRNPKETTSLMNYTFLYGGYDWNPERGYNSEVGLDTNPWRASNPGRSNGLTLVLDAQVGEYYCSSTASIGFKTMLHNPVEAPKMSDLAFFLAPGSETRIEILPKITESAESLRNIPLDKRLCLFQEERHLAFFRTYTQRNCQLECQSNFTLMRCNCVPFYLPKSAENRICTTFEDDCVFEARDQMDHEPLHDHLNNTDEDVITLRCNCLPGCDMMEYGKLMSSSKLEDGFAIKSDFLQNRDSAYYKGNMAVAHFFFIEKTFNGIVKGEIFGFTEFLSNTGGLLGLFLGFSIMSAAEILYFLSLRMLCSWWRHRKQRRPQVFNDRHLRPFVQ